MVKNGETGPGAVYQCAYEAYVRTAIFEPLGMHNTGFLPNRTLWPSCAPAENGTAHTQSQNKGMQGQVSDGNAYAMGGIAGHAGLFSNAPDLAVYAHAYMFGAERDTERNQLRRALPPAIAQDDAEDEDEAEHEVAAEERSDRSFFVQLDATRRGFGGGAAAGSFPWLNSTTLALWARETQNSFALGWNTKDPTMHDEGWNLSCGAMSPFTYLHTGYSAEICADSENEFFTILLTNRVFPTGAPGSDLVYAARVAFNTAAYNAVVAARKARAVAEEEDAARLRLRGSAPEPVPYGRIVTPFIYPVRASLSNALDLTNRSDDSAAITLHYWVRMCCECPDVQTVQQFVGQ